MSQQIKKIFLLLIVVTKCLHAQNSEISKKINNGEFKMTFPSIYFKHNSTEYAAMPYPVDSCYLYIVKNVKYINDLVIWRDTLESEKLSKQRIKKIRNALHKYKEVRGIPIDPMGKEQKISRHTIEMSSEKEYLLSLNSVFEISATRFEKQAKYIGHIMRPRIWCWACWRHGFHTIVRRKLKKMKKMEKEAQMSTADKIKIRRRLIWTGWKTGFHWSAAGKIK